MKGGAGTCELHMEEEWLHAERCVARRPSPSTPGWEVLVKWQGQVGSRSPGGAGKDRLFGDCEGVAPDSAARLGLGVDGVKGKQGQVSDRGEHLRTFWSRSTTAC